MNVIIKALMIVPGWGFDIGDLFDQAFGGGGGGSFHFQMGGMGGHQQVPRAARLPSSIKNVIADEFAWLKGTEWTWNNRVTVKFGIDGFFLSEARECSHMQQCPWAAYQDRIYVMMPETGLHILGAEKHPNSWAAEDLMNIQLSGKRSEDGTGVRLIFKRIFDSTSREDALDLYGLLGVSVEANTADIKKAYRRLTMEHHPDQNQGDPTALSRFNEITKANEILTDPTKRMLYDIGGMEAIRSLDKGEIQKGQDVLMEVGVPLSVLFTGGTINPKYKRRIVCSGCRANPRMHRCQGCSRCPSEIRTVNQQVGPGFYVQQQVQVDSKELCKVEDTPLDISIEKGSASGDQIVLERMAEQRPGMIPGNVIVRIRQVEDASFSRDGNNIKTTMTVGLREALLGFRKEIAHLDGTIVPLITKTVTQPMQIIRVPGEGMPLKNDPDTRGDLYVTVKIEFPKQLSRDQQELIANLFEQTTPKEIRADEL